MCDIAFASDDCQIGYPPMRGMTTPDLIYFPWKLQMARAKYPQLSGNSITGQQAAERGWIAKSFPADKLEEEVMRPGRKNDRWQAALASPETRRRLRGRGR